ncbi:MAG TPA: nucleotidyl transferase AbiEii/AbiGii toxin family protein [Phycisphaerae bacterium]|nr:nucleotidyl transferase AbiEii/AbiGii toxin family protein [Phycisphaerae bacterium]
MTRRPPKDLAASVRQRLLNRSRERGEEFNLVLTRYALERWLFRLSKSPFAKQFVLKGALLFTLWAKQTYRPTRDLDLLAYGEWSAERLERTIKQVCRTPVPPDGLEFDAESVRVTEIREAQEYGGLRVQVVARLDTAEAGLRIDVGFGDAVTPAPAEVTYPTLLATFPAPVLRAYSRETVIAEKLEAMVRLGFPNSRMKDFYDVWILSREFEFDGRVLSQAIRATFGRRKTRIPESVPLALSPEFAEDPLKGRYWSAFLDRHALSADAPVLAEVIRDLKQFLMPLLVSVAGDKGFRKKWPVGGPWS